MRSNAQLLTSCSAQRTPFRSFAGAPARALCRSCRYRHDGQEFCSARSGGAGWTVPFLFFNSALSEGLPERPRVGLVDDTVEVAPGTAPLTTSICGWIRRSACSAKLSRAWRPWPLTWGYANPGHCARVVSVRETVQWDVIGSTVRNLEDRVSNRPSPSYQKTASRNASNAGSGEFFPIH
jgi:hypothetical protein